MTKQKATKNKIQHRETLLNYLGNPANEFPTRKFMNDVILDFKQSRGYIYKIFTTEELADIEWEALHLRRTKYGPGISMVDRALIQEALKGDTAAIKLCYQRFEDWGEKRKLIVKDTNWTTEIIDPKNEEE